jgi:hypothetical protein
MAWVRPADRQPAVFPHDCGLGGLGDLGALAPAQRPVRADRDRDRRPLPGTVVNGFVLAWVYNSTGGSVLLVMLLHAAQNATNGVVQQLFDGAPQSPSPTTYYLVSTLTFGVLMGVVAVATRGRLGLSASGADSPTSTA